MFSIRVLLTEFLSDDLEIIHIERTCGHACFVPRQLLDRHLKFGSQDRDGLIACAHGRSGLFEMLSTHLEILEASPMTVVMLIQRGLDLILCLTSLCEHRFGCFTISYGSGDLCRQFIHFLQDPLALLCQTLLFGSTCLES